LKKHLLVLALLPIVAAACGDDDDAAETTLPVVTAIPPTESPRTVAPTTVAPTTEAPGTTESPPTTAAPSTEEPTTTEAPTTIAAPTTTEAPASGNVGVVWASQVDPARVNAQGQPVFEALGVTARVEQVLYVSAEGTAESSQACRDEIQYSETAPPGTDHCMIVQWSFDVSAELTDEASLTAGSMLTPDGLQIDSYASESGLPGAKNRVVVAAYPGGTPGSTVRFDLSTGEPNYESETQTFQIPPKRQMQPIDF
jgi:hypothetical protein